MSEYYNILRRTFIFFREEKRLIVNVLDDMPLFSARNLRSRFTLYDTNDMGNGIDLDSWEAHILRNALTSVEYDERATDHTAFEKAQKMVSRLDAVWPPVKNNEDR